jgi:hypothetical protein
MKPDRKYKRLKLAVVKLRIVEVTKLRCSIRYVMIRSAKPVLTGLVCSANGNIFSNMLLCEMYT